jgi:hypothetical protein
MPRLVLLIRTLVIAYAAGANNEAAAKDGGQTDLGAELVTDPCLALGDAVDLGLVQGIDLVLALRRLLEQATDQPERFQYLSAQRTFGNVLGVAAQVGVCRLAPGRGGA